MPRERLTFRQRDLRAAIKAAIEAGLTVSEVTVSRDGEIKILTAPPSDAKAKRKNTWDDLYENPPELRKPFPGMRKPSQRNDAGKRSTDGGPSGSVSR